MKMWCSSVLLMIVMLFVFVIDFHSSFFCDCISVTTKIQRLQNTGKSHTPYTTQQPTRNSPTPTHTHTHVHPPPTQEREREREREREIEREREKEREEGGRRNSWWVVGRIRWSSLESETELSNKQTG